MAATDDPRPRFFARSLALAPEDASSLGDGSGDDRLRDVSPRAFDAEERALIAIVAEVETWEPRDAAASLDRHAMLRRALSPSDAARSLGPPEPRADRIVGRRASVVVSKPFVVSWWSVQP